MLTNLLPRRRRRVSSQCLMVAIIAIALASGNHVWGENFGGSDFDTNVGIIYDFYDCVASRSGSCTVDCGAIKAIPYIDCAPVDYVAPECEYGITPAYCDSSKMECAFYFSCP